MISTHFEAMVTSLLPAEEFVLFRRSDLPRLPAHTVDLFLSRAEKALRAELRTPSLADWIASPSGYDALRGENRRSLAALCLGEAVHQRGRYLPQAAQLVFAILSEPDWNAAGRRHAPARLLSMPDSFAAQTAELLAWAAVLLEQPLEEYAIGLREGVYQACEERFLRFLDDPACCETVLRRTDAPDFARAATAACLIVPQNESLRWLRLKNALRIADRCASGGWALSAFQREGLVGWTKSSCAIADAALLADLACAGQSGLRADEALLAQMRLPVHLHIDGEYFADEKSRMQPALFGEDLYRIGATFDDDAMCSLGAMLDRLARQSETPRPDRPEENITARLLSALWRSSLEKDGGSMPPEPVSCLQGQCYYAARPHSGRGFYVGLHAGALVLFLDGQPVLITAPGAAERRSLPEPDGRAQARFSCRDVSVRIEGFPTITMDIAPSFPLDASISSWQRTVMLTNQDQTVRLLDAFDYAGVRRPSRLRFVSPSQPVPAVGAPRARIGGAYVEWDGPTHAAVEQLNTAEGEAPLWALVLSRPEAAAGGCWTCTFTRAD
ncbi:MAG: hypothetical protein Q4A66_01200 [Eubacteriales bacterium]|nr:hypothetical protein [Eubacteriales bacterium]